MILEWIQENVVIICVVTYTLSTIECCCMARRYYQRQEQIRERQEATQTAQTQADRQRQLLV
jgi:hypothetical protein